MLVPDRALPRANAFGAIPAWRCRPLSLWHSVLTAR